MKTIKCSKCGKEHNETTSSCCWINCECDNQICGRCGSANIRVMDPEDDDAQYWCCKQCEDCGLEGCAMCI